MRSEASNLIVMGRVLEHLASHNHHGTTVPNLREEVARDLRGRNGVCSAIAKGLTRQDITAALTRLQKMGLVKREPARGHRCGNWPGRPTSYWHLNGGIRPLTVLPKKKGFWSRLFRRQKLLALPLKET
jgi:DNA-binding transcriptional ArsR family regulator